MKWVLRIVGSLIVLLVIFTEFVLPALWKWRTPTSQIAALSKAKAETELQEAIKPLGVLIHRVDGTWIAIAYADQHSPTILSSAIAKDSSGHWFKSNYHFCGALAGYRIELRDRLAMEKSEEKPDLKDEPDDFLILDAIRTAPSLEEADAKLLAYHFKRMK